MIVVNVSDLHNGSHIGMWAPGMYDPDTEDPTPIPQNRTQEWLDAQWQTMLAELRALNEPIWTVIDGDPIQGANHRDGQLMSDKTYLQVKSAFHYLKPLRELSERMYMVHGTAFHDGVAGQDVMSLADMLDCHPNAQGVNLWWDLYLKVDGHVAHFTHHVSATNLPFYEATAPLRDYYVLISELFRVYGENAPGVELAVRAHRHRSIVVHKPPRIHVAVSPCWQLKNEFPWKVAPNTFPDIGYLLIETMRRGFVVTPRVFPLPPPHIEEAPVS